MFREYTKSLFKRVDKRQLMQFKPPRLPQRIYTKTLSIDNKHYSKFCQEVAWPVSEHVHPLYLQMLSLPLQMRCLLDKQSPFPLLGLIHCANAVEIFEHCNLSESIECRVRFSDVRPHSRGWEIDVLLEAFQSSKRVYKAVSSYLVKVKAVHVAPRGTQSKNAGRNAENTESKQRDFLSSLSATADTGRRYAAISGDYNPIHLSTVSAKAFGFKNAIAHGMWTLSRVISQFVEAAGPEASVASEAKAESTESTVSTENSAIQQGLDKNNRVCNGDIKKVECQFKQPVFLPNELNIYTLSASRSEGLNDHVDEIPNANEKTSAKSVVSGQDYAELEVMSAKDSITHLNTVVYY
ncbi:MaoC family dehydratase [Alteromonas sp. BMJM2]|uniref:MaoC family dehydratase n=1 Tax=Alteromonas sp. BMJM2 TaxID=2954241 RepID=UPI0022B36587|nr:MaoC/PaaZ C-terminal domain-containing protein [Alteromonas sp. BMJM2]